MRGACRPLRRLARPILRRYRRSVMAATGRRPCARPSGVRPVNSSTGSGPMIPERLRNALGFIAASLLLLLTACGQPQVAIGGPFKLVDQYGRPQDQSIL